MRKSIEVAAAIIIKEGKVFAARRGYGEFKGWWEFPGGKLEPGESPREALERELGEEMRADVCVGPRLMTADYSYPGFDIRLHFYVCSLSSGDITLLEHDASRWLEGTELRSVDWLPADKGVIEALEALTAGVSPEVVGYVEEKIIPRYDGFDKAHRRDHARMVINRSLALAERLPELNRDMVYCIAAFHDLGLVNGREKHHLDSGLILEADSFVRERFSAEQIETMRQAVEDHRASGKSEPRSLYGMVVADADRFIDPETIIRRTVQYGLANYPQLDRAGHFDRTLGHLCEKYGPEGYLRVWLTWSGNAVRLRQLHEIIADRQSLAAIFDRIFDEETANPARPYTDRHKS